MQDQALPHDATDLAVRSEWGREPVSQQARHAFQPFAVFYKVTEFSAGAVQQGSAGFSGWALVGVRSFHNDDPMIPRGG